ncbi:tetratricopeptide repeat protein, partial [Streptomyces collinus]|uniref:tetratricopeptide repeat protein n=1 Tax=Streptomyces collinus TaxID=42684 RepID=UPI0033FE4CF8
MQFERRVQIRLRKPGTDRQGFGSGYLIAPRLVLTAAHVINGADPADPDALQVSRPDASGQEFPAAVRWQRLDEAVDAALIEIRDGHGWQTPGSLNDLLTQPPQRYGLLIGTRPHPVTLTGFPRMQKDLNDGQRLDEQLTGCIAPGTGSLAGRYEIISTDPTLPTALPAGAPGSRWSGISGAAVLTDDGSSGDLLCGVVRRDRQADGGTRLTATSAARLLADPGFRTLVTEHTGWEPVLEPVEPAALLTTAAVARTFRSPAALLRADAEAVAFHGRITELTDLRTWCEKGTTGLAIQVLTGPGGQGKTRLARRLTDLLGWDGWVTGHLRSDLTDDPAPESTPPDFTTLSTALPLLLVVDYAETRPRLLRRLVTHLHRSRHRIRLLLLARSDGDWRTGSFQSVPDVRDLLDEAPVVPLGPLTYAAEPAQDRPSAFQRAIGDLAQDRPSAFRQAADDLARLLPEVPTLPPHDWSLLAGNLPLPADLSHPRYDNVLTLQMTALVTLLQHGPRPADAPPGTPPERTLLRHEERFWDATAKTPAYKLDLPVPILGVAVAAAALCGAATPAEALQVVNALPGLPEHQQTSAAAWLASLYPGGVDRFWGSLQPDRVAEYHASRILEEHSSLLPALLAAGTPAQQAQTVTVLARAAIAHYNAGRTTDSKRVVHVLDTALETAPLAYRALQTASAALPYPSRIIAPFALRLAASLAHANMRPAQDNPAALAASLSNLGVRLAEAGRRDEALTAAEEAVEIYRRLAADNPTAHGPDLALSLSNLGVRLADAGRRNEALTVAEEAVEIRRRLAADNPTAHGPDLALSLSNLGVQLAAVGRRDEAFTAAEEAVEIYRRLAADNPTAYGPDLAASLSNLGIRLAEAGRGDEALTATEEAAQIRRRLAADNPAAHEPDLAASLSNLGIQLAAVGRRDEALTAAEKAVEIRRRLAADNPAAHEPDLAASLSNLGIRLAEAGRRNEALISEHEAVEIRRRLAADNPTAYRPVLASSLSNLGVRLVEVGRRDEALTAVEEAVEIRRRLAADNPAAHEPELALSLSNLGVQLAAVGRRDEAFTVAEEAVEIRRRLAADNPTAYRPVLAFSLSNLGIRLAEAGRRDEALISEQEAVEIRRRLAADNPAAHEPDLAVSLSNLGVQLAAVGRQDEALTVAEEAVEIRRRLAADNPAAHRPDLALSLSNLGVRLAEAGRRDEALTAVEEAVEIRRRLAADNPAAHRPDLALSLSNLGVRL